MTVAHAHAPPRNAPFGTFRGTGSLPTDRGYTGQIKEGLGTTIGAYYYNARFYSSANAVFMSADTLTTDGLNRYAYVRGNPLRYNDPSGHGVTNGGSVHEQACASTHPDCAITGVGLVGGNGQPEPVAERCHAGCQALRVLANAGLTSPELVQQAARAAAPAVPNVRTSENRGGGGGCGWSVTCHVKKAFSVGAAKSCVTGGVHLSTLDACATAVQQLDLLPIGELSCAVPDEMVCVVGSAIDVGADLAGFAAGSGQIIAKCHHNPEAIANGLVINSGNLLFEVVNPLKGPGAAVPNMVGETVLFAAANEVQATC